MDEHLGKSELRKKIMAMILPITLENILQMLTGLVSMAIVGRIDTVAVGAIGLSSRVTQIIWALFKGISTGASVFVAQAYGAGNFNKLKTVIQQTLLSTVAFVIILQQIIYWKAPVLLSIFNPSDNLMANGLVYLRTVSWGLPFVVIMLVVAGVLQGMGNAKTPMKIALIMNIVNIIVSFALIFGYMGFSPMGIRGAALATVIAQFIGAMIGLYVLFNKDGVLNSVYNGSFFKFDIKQIGDVYRVGLPTSFESIFWQIAAIILTKIILSFGEVSYAAYQLGLQAESISYMPALGFGVAATTFVGQSLGAGDKEIGKVYLKELVKGSILITIVGASMLIFLPNVIMRILTNDVEVAKLGAVYLILMGFVQIPQSLSGVLNGALRGAGFTRVPMIVAAAGLWGIRIPLSYILTHYFNMGIVTIWVVICIDLVFRFGLSYVLYKSKDIYNKEFAYEEPECAVK